MARASTPPCAPCPAATDRRRSPDGEVGLGPPLIALSCMEFVPARAAIGETADTPGLDARRLADRSRWNRPPPPGDGRDVDRSAGREQRAEHHAEGGEPAGCDG